jgi:hypothetical protein
MSFDFHTYRHNVTSQSGEDGVLAKLFEIIGAENLWCVEFGAGDGKQNSNTWDLINNHAWSAVVIEADRSEYVRLRRRYAGSERVRTIQAIVERDGPSGLATLLGRTTTPKDFDLLVVDIDGDDYHVWDAFEDYRPRVVVVEFNHTIPFDVSFVQAYQAPVRGGASLAALRMLGEKKGYVLVYAHGSNALFVDKSIAAAHGLEPASDEALRLATPHPQPYFQLYDGSVVLWGGGEGISRRASRRKYIITPVWLGGGNVISPVVFSREWSLVRRMKEIIKETQLYPHGRALYDRWLRRSIRRARHVFKERHVTS